MQQQNTQAGGLVLPELLAPAGNPERLRVALNFGADAVYVGLKAMSLRNFADNFTPRELAEGCALAHGLGRRVYVTLNAFAHDEDLDGLPVLLDQAAEAGADALIVNDPGVIRLARRLLPAMPRARRLRIPGPPGRAPAGLSSAQWKAPAPARCG